MDFTTIFNTIVDTLIPFSVWLLLFSLGLGLNFGQAFVLVKQPKKLIMTVLAASVLVVVVAVIMLYGAQYLGLNIALEIQVSILLLAGAAGSGMVPAMVEKVGASAAEAVSAMIMVVLATVIIEPIVVAVFFPPLGVELSAVEVLTIVVNSILVPLFLGLAIRTWWLTMANFITDPLTKLAGGLLQITILLIIMRDLGTMLDLGLWNLGVMAVFIVVFIAIGHLLGGSALPDRLTMGATAGLRNGAIALLVASRLPETLGANVAFQVLNLIMIIAYITIFSKRLPAEDGEAAVSVTASAKEA
jgi:BASS family bile acid:Na+ symporter